MATETQLDYYERMALVKRYIREHLDEPINRDDLARLVGFSAPHFHRIFTAHIGENMTAYVRRLRMERAAQQLRVQVVNVTQIALDSGYETHSAFSKAFKGFFGVSPTEFRELNATAAAHLINRRMPFTRKDLFMQPREIRTLPDLKVLYARATERLTTPAFQCANQEAFGKLMSFLGATGLMAQMKHCVAIYPDEVEEGKSARFDAGAIFAPVQNPPRVMAWLTKPCLVDAGLSSSMSAPTTPSGRPGRRPIATGCPPPATNCATLSPLRTM